MTTILRLLISLKYLLIVDIPLTVYAAAHALAYRYRRWRMTPAEREADTNEVLARGMLMIAAWEAQHGELE